MHRQDAYSFLSHDCPRKGGHVTGDGQHHNSVEVAVMATQCMPQLAAQHNS